MNIEVDVPDGVSGNWRVETFVVDRPPLYHAIRGRDIPVGTYKRLMCGSTLVMSNTPTEINDFIYFICKAKGNVLINGLGLGVVLKAILAKPEVESVTIIELHDDVIKLVAPTFNNDPRVAIIHADAFAWKPPKDAYYDAVWHDCWDSICEDNLKGMEKLHRKYGKRCSYQDSWSRDMLLYLRRRG
jgi:hypothetical protein